ncbi:hypothetical protein H4R19_001168 [Coemansia spiralis]|nr:hypothetical protein H4R19_001168 [Coemansia spiralis]
MSDVVPHFDYLKSIGRQEIELGTADLASFGITVDGVYLYRNGSGDPQFMALDRIARGFCRVVAEHYPVIVARPTVSADGRAVLVVDPDNLCLPDIAELVVDRPAEDFIETRSYDAEGAEGAEGAAGADAADAANGVKHTVRFFNLPRFYRTSGIRRPPQASYNRDHAAAIVRVIRFRDSPYVALYISLSHAMFDGSGVTAFFNHWAAYTRHVDDAAVVLDAPPTHDRRAVRAYFDGVEGIEPPHLAHFRECAAALPMASPANIAPILIATPDIAPCEEQHLLHITPARLEQLRQDVDKTQTTFIALAALLTKSMLHANVAAMGAVPRRSYVMFPYDCRKRTPIPAAFSGNLSFPSFALLDPPAVLAGSYSDVARAIAGQSALMSGAHAKATVDVIEKELHILYHASATMGNKPDTAYVGMSNVRYLPLYSLDYGWGGPDILSCDYFIQEGMMRLYANKQDGGIDVILNYPDRCFEHLQKSDDLLRYADPIF